MQVRGWTRQLFVPFADGEVCIPDYIGTLAGFGMVQRHVFKVFEYCHFSDENRKGSEKDKPG
jgi:hypothetical protein